MEWAATSIGSKAGESRFPSGPASQRFVSQYASRIFLLWGAMMVAVRKWRFERLRPGSNGLAFAPPARFAASRLSGLRVEP